jgi:hypothetical protein
MRRFLFHSFDFTGRGWFKGPVFKINGGKSMTLNYSRILVLASVLGVTSSFAQDVDYLTVASMKISRIQQDVLNQEVSQAILEKDAEAQSILDLPGMPNKAGQVSSSNPGKIIQWGKELVALGEDIYRLVDKGRPVVKTSYAPISVIPKSGREAVDIFDTENWKMPSKATYEIVYTNLYGIEVVKYRYSVIFTYGGTYQGKGAYLTAAQIIPVSVDVLWGYSFSATMKLSGIQNHGTKENPVAGAILAMEYSVETIVKSSLETDSYHITGRGGFKQL